MTDDLQHDLRELPPSLDVPDDFYERVITRARRRRRVVRAGATGVTAAVVAAVVAVGVSLTSTSDTARIVPVTPAPTASAVTPTPAPTPTPTPTDSPSPTATVTSAPPTEAPSTSTPATVVDYPPLSYANLPYPVCPSGYVADATAGGTQFCIPPGYAPTGSPSCPPGSFATMGPVLCFSNADHGMLVGPASDPGLPPVRYSSLPNPACASGEGAVDPPPHCAPAAYLPRAGYACPAGSGFGSFPAYTVALCFTSGSTDTIVAPVPSS